MLKEKHTEPKSTACAPRNSFSPQTSGHPAPPAPTMVHTGRWVFIAVAVAFALPGPSSFKHTLRLCLTQPGMQEEQSSDGPFRAQAPKSSSPAQCTRAHGQGPLFPQLWSSSLPIANPSFTPGNHRRWRSTQEPRMLCRSPGSSPANPTLRHHKAFGCAATSCNRGSLKRKRSLMNTRRSAGSGISQIGELFQAWTQPERRYRKGGAVGWGG